MPLISKDMTDINRNVSLAPVDAPELTAEWDKVFPENKSVSHSKVAFVNRYGITLVADMYKPRECFEKNVCNSCVRPVRGSQGAELRAVRAGTRFKRLCDNSI